jgi:antirestriction protein ArdC
MMGYRSPWWLTLKQANALGGSIRKGEQGTPVVFWRLVQKRESSNGQPQQLPLLRHSMVFNLEQTEGLNDPDSENASQTPPDPVEACEAIIQGFCNGPRIKEGGDAAFYSLTEDLIAVPGRNQFGVVEEFYSTLFHELTHSTAHPTRLNRKLISLQASRDTQVYDKEELIAEMGSSMLCAHANIDSVTFDNSVAYLAGWVQAFKDKPKMLVEAASAAQKAVNLILGLSGARDNRNLESDNLAKGKVQKEEVI